MTRFLFWNIRGKPLERLIANMARLHDLDFILLAESSINPELCRKVLQDATKHPYYFFGSTLAAPHDPSTHLQVYSRLGPSQMSPVSVGGNSKRFRVFRLHEGNPLAIDVLLVLTHAPNKLLGGGREEQSKFFRRLRRGIEQSEVNVDHHRTILVGDMNVDPFDPMLIGACRIHAIPAREIAGRGHRRYDGRLRRFFYNPMWCLYGDRRSHSQLADDPTDSAEPIVPGTYFFDKSRINQLYWHMLDQVLIRPELIPRFPLRELRIVGRIGDNPLIRKGRPTPSDHLPIFFQVDLRKESVDAYR